MFSSCIPKFFAVRNIHYSLNTFSDYFHTDAVVPSSDHCRTQAVLPPRGHFCTETVSPSSDHYETTNIVPPSDHLHTKTTKHSPKVGVHGSRAPLWLRHWLLSSDQFSNYYILVFFTLFPSLFPYKHTHINDVQYFILQPKLLRLQSHTNLCPLNSKYKIHHLK